MVIFVYYHWYVFLLYIGFISNGMKMIVKSDGDTVAYNDKKPITVMAMIVMVMMMLMRIW